MLALATSLDSAVDRLTGFMMLLGGIVVITRRGQPVVATALVVAGLSWMLAVGSIGPFSTLFAHRALLAAALAIAAEPLWHRAATVVPLAAMSIVSVVPTWSQRPAVLLAAWGAVIARTTWVVWASPRRTRVLPALAAHTIMLAVAASGRLPTVLTPDERRLLYFAATIALALLTVRVATAPVTPEVVLEGRRGRADWAIGRREPGADDFVTADGRAVATLQHRRVIEFDVGPLGTAVLAHDDPAFDDPAMEPRLQNVVRMMSERIALIDQIRAQRADVAASRQRLLIAEQLAASALRRDIVRDVRPHLDAIATTLVALGLQDHRAGQLLADVRVEVEGLASGSMPPDLAEGLLAAIRALADRTVIPTTLRLAPVDVTEPAALALFMIASEATTNAVKHSGAERITIELSVEPDLVTLRVADDGVGGAVARLGGGIDHAAHRLGELGGSLSVESALRGGTVVVARLPNDPR